MDVFDLIPFLRRSAEPQTPADTLPVILKRLNGGAENPANVSEELQKLIDARNSWSVHKRELEAQLQKLVAEGASKKVRQAVRDEISHASEEIALLEQGEAPLTQRLARVQADARRRRWSELRAAFLGAAEEFHQAALAAGAKHTAVIEIVTRARGEGFEHEADAMMPPTPNKGGSAVLAPDLLAKFWRDVQATSASANPAPPAAKPKASPTPAARTAIWSPSGDTFAPLPRDVPSLQHAISSTYPPANSLGFFTAHRSADDTGPLEVGQARVMALHSGWSPRDNAPQCHAGQTLRMDASAARAAADRGQVEIIETYMPPAAPEPEASPAPGVGS